MFFAYQAINLIFGWEWSFFITSMAGIGLSYFFPSLLPEFKGISKTNPMRYIGVVFFLFFSQGFLIIVFSLLFTKASEQYMIVKTINTLVAVFMITHMQDNFPDDDTESWRAGVSRRFQEMMEKYERSYPPQLAPVPT
jgi:hypothetical protein